ncbi:hypothetical protein AB0F17_08235 [Nonomuraea sp. NPDC026600]|uniref:hypothetical protein n=1 Tax=Nonomuraea sp. NPDC026600 TaxID=3155363 RepID=UPI0033E11342
MRALRRTAHQLWSPVSRRVGHRGTALLFFALVDLVYSASLASAPPETLASPSYVFLAQLLPIPVWAVVWLVVGLLCLMQAFMRSDRLAFACASALKVGWGLIYLVGWIVVDLPRGYVAAAIWLAFAGFVHVISRWPEPGGDR